MAAPVLKTLPDSAASAALAVSQSFPLASSGTPVASSAEFSSDLLAFLRPFTPDAFANGFATLVGALLGAMLAYLLQRRFQRSQERASALTSAHRLMFSLLQQINTIVLIQRDHVYEHLAHPGRFLAIPALPPFDTKKNVLELPELTFLLADSEARKLLYDFYIAQENYIEALNQWNLRSAFHLERLQPSIAASGIANGSVTTNEEIREAIGDQIYVHAVTATNNCIETLQRAFQNLAEIKGALRPYLIRRFCTQDFTDFDFPETWGLVTSSSPESK